jgi:hypothetical protein
MGPHCSRDNLVHVLCLLSLAEDLRPSAILELATGDPLAGKSSKVPVHRIVGSCVDPDQHANSSEVGCLRQRIGIGP